MVYFESPLGKVFLCFVCRNSMKMRYVVSEDLTTRISRFDRKFSVYFPFIFSNLGSGIPCLQVCTEYFKFPLKKRFLVLLCYKVKPAD